MPDEKPPASEVILFQTEDAQARVEVRFQGETAWLSIGQMTELFQRDKSVISRHIRNVFEEGELPETGTVAKFATVQSEGGREVSREVEYYSLDVIISVGYRVKSHRGTQFRIWATQRLREYLVKGFTMDDERLKRGGGGNYFDELLARIRDIRSSERVFWRKALDIFATSVDYDRTTNEARKFFAAVQNKLHWAAHGHTAAEVLLDRADATKPNMGLTTWAGKRIRKDDAGIAKNYLSAEELELLNRLVSQYLDFAELQALSRKVMYMRDWARRLDDFIRFNERNVLDDLGSASHEDALRHAEAEYEKFRRAQLAAPQPVDADFEAQAKQLEKGRKPPPKKGGKEKP